MSSLKRTRSAMTVGSATAVPGSPLTASLSARVSEMTLLDATETLDAKELGALTLPSASAVALSPPLTTLTTAGAATEPATEPVSLSNYKVLSTVRQTIYGCVQCAEDSKGNKFAVKKSKRSDVSKHSTLECPATEVEVLKALKPHPNVIQCFGAGADGQWDFTVLELCDGGDLFDLLERDGKLSASRARSIFSHVASGLRHVHTSGFAHLDVSPENILMKGGQAKLCDFGMARALCPKFPASKNEKPGKLAYMAPEIYALTEFNGEQADVWSLGVVLFIMLTGFPPYRFPNDTDPRFRMIYAGRTARLLELSGVRVADIPQQALNLLERMLAPATKRISLQDVLNHAWLQDEVHAC